MKKLLIISYFFAPAAKIGAVRWTKLAKYLNATGKYDIDIITGDYECAEDKLLAADLDKVGNVIKITPTNNRFSFVGAGASDGKAKSAMNKVSFKDRVKVALKNNPLIYDYIQNKFHKADYERSVDFFEQTKKYIEQNGGLSKYDIIVSTYGPVADTLIALWIKEQYPDIPLIIDFRDPMWTYSMVPKYRKIYKKMQSEICKKADAVVVVSNGKETFFTDVCNSGKMHIITNGYDLADFPAHPEPKSDRFLISYAGTLFHNQTDFTPLFKILSELSAENKIDLSDVEIKYAGGQFPIIYSQAIQCGLESIMTDLGFIQRSDIIKLLQSSHIVLLAVVNSKKEHGRLPGKFFECTASGTPLAAFITGGLSQSELRRNMEIGNFGTVYEDACHSIDYPKMKQFILDQYNSFKTGKPNFSPDKDVIDQFNYINIAARYDALIEQITE